MIYAMTDDNQHHDSTTKKSQHILLDLYWNLCWVENN